MICEDCEYFHIKNPVGYSKAFCANWKNSVGEIKTVIRKCKYYKKKEAINGNDKERHDKIVEEQDEYIELLRAEVKQLRQENRLIDKNAAAVQKEYKKEIERLQGAYLRAVTERDNAIFQLTRLKAERDKAVEDLENLIDCHCACSYCANLIPDGTCEAERKYGVCTCLPKWRGLEGAE